MDETLHRPRFGAPREPVPSRNPGRGLVHVLNFAMESDLRATILLIVCGLLFFLPGFFNIPPIDRDEARFAQATKQMVESGDFVDIRFQSEVRYKKPVGIYWLQAAAVETASKLGLQRAQIRIWLYRVPSLIGGIGAVLLTYWTALAFLSRRGAILAALIMCSSILLGVEARLAKTDAMLLLTTTAVMGAMARVYLSWQRGEEPAHRSWLVPAIFWTALAGGMLLKGPLILMFVALTIVALAIMDRSAAWLWRLRPIIGAIWALALVLPWFVAIFLKAGDSFFADSLGGDMLSKVANAQESHGAPPGLYFVIFWLTFWPGSALAGMAAPAIWRAKREPSVQFLLAWLVPAWLIFEIVITKLPHYVLPLYPAIAILITGVLERRMLSQTPWIVRGAAWWFVLPALLSVTSIITAMAVLRQPAFAAWPFAAAALIFGLVAWWMYDEDRAERSLLNAIAASWALGTCVWGVVLPAMKPVFPSVEIARALRSVECVGPVAAAAGFQEPSLVFMVGTQTLLTNGSGAADFLSQGSCRFALVEWREEKAFAQRAETIGLHYAPVKRIDGYNYSQGRAISVAVFRSDSID
ncbi:MAG: glycosyltransferase family 39 protein [Afipia sp.]|nr:glycosyltransferase family 39 protein [Afipia sp.]OJW63946.1 MAG: glycosyl transferase [Afipia sp. 64-13]